MGEFKQPSKYLQQQTTPFNIRIYIITLLGNIRKIRQNNQRGKHLTNPILVRESINGIDQYIAHGRDAECYEEEPEEAHSEGYVFCFCVLNGTQINDNKDGR